ncbi:HlyD family secretion protein [Pantoea sp. A4]|uniref:HlyD family secretion protein n=1 Tax=Pantoea sp. A4 TaxID=1225184 RepID=UPI0003652E53|nr:HlyD family secretion protein [Pantoea sp. A4]
MLQLSVSSSAPDVGTAPTPAPAKSKNRVLRIVVLALLAIAALVALWWFFFGRYSESTNDAYLQADSVTLAPKIAGNVSEVLVADNQQVKAGQPLVRINDDQYLAKVSEMQAMLLARQASIQRANADITRQQAEIEQAEAKQQSAQVQMHYAEHEFQRYQPLAATGAEAQEHLADLRRSRDQAKADYNANVAAVKAAAAQIQTLKAQISEDTAQLDSSKASLQQSSIDLHDTLITSPIDGVVGNRTVRVGQYVQPGTRLLTVVPTHDVYLVANFKETQMTRMRVGQPATLHVDADPDHDFTGVIESFSPGTGSQFALLPPENATGNFTKIIQRVPVRIRITDTSPARERLLPGMSVTVDVDTHHLQPDQTHE